MNGIIKNCVKAAGIDIVRSKERIGKWSVEAALNEKDLFNLSKKLRSIVPDISKQESKEQVFSCGDYWEVKRRAMHAFQCSIMLKALSCIPSDKITIVDIGDSAGTHMLYIKELTKGRFNIDTISVNLDHRAIDKIKQRGLRAILCRAEDLDLGDVQVDLFTSFEMIEHLHNPAIFLRRLAKKNSCERMVFTVPYLKQSRVGLHHVRHESKDVIFAEDEHIFELSPQDWTLLMLHSGWKVTYQSIFYQYPRKIPILRRALEQYWRITDFEGFWGAILEKDTSFSDLYQDWED
jgi:2-polyprenyl-3-methyl-5-hydroxy-6-metoxy-1,4-benzoquinol methylase